MQRQVTGFHQDEEGALGRRTGVWHYPHVHHDAPWECRPWGRHHGGLAMTTDAHLWAIGHDDTALAGQVRDHIARLGESRSLVLLDSAVAVRYPDRSFTLDGEPFVTVVHKAGRTLASLFAGLVLGAPRRRSQMKK